MAYSYKGSISFGLVYIPVTLHSAVRDNSISFNMIDKKTMSRVKYKKTCADCDGREVKQEDIVKGFEYEEGKYVVFDDAGRKFGIFYAQKRENFLVALILFNATRLIFLKLYAIMQALSKLNALFSLW